MGNAQFDDVDISGTLKVKGLEVNGGGGGGGSGISSLLEKWHRENVAAGLAATPMSALVSINFDDLKMIRAGSIVGISTRWSSVITAGSTTITITINGVAGTLAITSTSGQGSQAVQAAGIDTYNAGDLVGMQITTNGGFLPAGTNDVEAWLEVRE